MLQAPPASQGQSLGSISLAAETAAQEAGTAPGIGSTPQRLQALFDGALNGILLVDDSGTYVDANPAICRLLGYGRDELVGMTVHQLVVEQAQPAAMWRRFIDERRQIGRVALRHKRGHRVVVDYMATTNILPGLHLSVLEDASARVQAEEASQAALSAQQQAHFEAFRGELALDLHDEIGQSLSALQLEADRLEALAPDAAERIRGLVRQGITSLRDISRSLRPPTLDLGLVPALKALARDTTQRSDLDVATEFPAQPRPLPAPLELALYRVAQEALNNALRHSGATRLSLRLVQDEATLTLEVCDNGRGFQPATVAATAGLGLQGMQERARAAGAELDILSTPGAGSLIRVRCPLASGEPSP